MFCGMFLSVKNDAENLTNTFNKFYINVASTLVNNINVSHHLISAHQSSATNFSAKTHSLSNFNLISNESILKIINNLKNGA